MEQEVAAADASADLLEEMQAEWRAEHRGEHGATAVAPPAPVRARRQRRAGDPMRAGALRTLAEPERRR